MYLKITNTKENHHGLQYHDGLNIDTVPFAKEGSCVPGGIYFTTPEHICGFLDHGIYIREVTIPEDAEMVMDPEGDKWRASKVILGPRKCLKEVYTWKWLVKIGVTINEALVCACGFGYGNIELIKFLVKNGADIHIQHDWALKWSIRYGNTDVVEYIQNGAITK